MIDATNNQPIPYSLVGESTILQMCATVRSTPIGGAIAEVGVYRGGSAYWLAKIARERKCELHLYDTFAGIPFKGEHDTHEVGDFKETSLADVVAAIPDAHYHVGVFPQTFMEDCDFSFVHVDCDQYQSVLDCIDTFAPHMLRDSVMWFDDYGCLRSAEKAIFARIHPSRLTHHAGKAFVRF